MAIGNPQSRKWNAESFLPYRLEALTPVFIGSGETFSPIDYVIRQSASGYKLWLVDSGAWLSAVSNRADVAAALNNGDMINLRAQMDDTLDAAVYGEVAIPFADNHIADKLRKDIQNRDSNSKAEILSFARNPYAHVALIPGSSLKGALSTPLIDLLDQERKAAGKTTLKMTTNKADPLIPSYAKVLEAMFGPIREHAMQAVKVADISMPPGSTSIVSGTIRAKNPSKQTGLNNVFESLLPNPPIALYGAMRMDAASGKPAIRLPNHTSITLKQLVRQCNAFYKMRFLEEWRNFYQLPQFSNVKQALAPIYDRISNLADEGELLLRLGRFSHIECVSVTENQPDAKKGYGQTRTISNMSLPFGWVILKFCTQAEYWEGVRRMEDAIDKELAANQKNYVKAFHEAVGAASERAREIAEKREKAEKAQAERARWEEETARKEAEREKARSESSKEEYLIWEVEQPDAIENKASDLYRMLDELDDNLKMRAARALKGFWERINKWQNKKNTKNQKEKVNKVKGILGE